MTPGLAITRRRVAAGGTGSTAVDLGEIRRSEEAINVLAARGAAGPHMSNDPALVLLGALIADVDTPGTRRASPQRGPAPAWPGRAERTVAWPALSGPPSRGAAAWLGAAIVGAVVAGLASITSLMATSTLARLTRGPASRGRRQPWAVRPRRMR